MANVTIPMLPAATVVNGSDLVVIDQAGVTKQATKTLLFSDLSFTNITLINPALGTPVSGTLTNCTDLPVSSGIAGLGANVATFLATPSSANLVSVVADGTGSGALVFADSPTLVTPDIGAPSAGDLTNCTNLPIDAGTLGELPVSRGGTGIGSIQSLTGPGAIDIVNLATAFSSTGTSDALTLEDGEQGQIKTIIYVAEDDAADTGILTPDNFGNGTTLTFNNVGDSAVLQFIGTDWWVVSLNGAAVA
jgi:hypothetical protein